MGPMTAIVTAGGEIQPDEPLYAVTGGGLKSMIDIHGKPMIQWVLDALCGSSAVDRVVVVGLPPETSLDCACPLNLLPDQGDMLSNIRLAARECLAIDPQSSHAVLASADIPALRSEIVDWLVCQAKGFEKDVYFTVIERSTMEAEYPDSRRSFAHLKNAQVCTGDLHCLRLQTALNENLLRTEINRPHNGPLQPASLLGYDPLFFLTLPRLTLEDAEASISQRLGINGQVVISPYAEIGMDVDKPSQLEFIREYLARRHARTTAYT